MKKYTLSNSKRYLLLCSIILIIAFLLTLVAIVLSNQNKNVVSNTDYTVSKEEKLALGNISDNIDIVYLKKGNLYGRSDENVDYTLTSNGNFSNYVYAPTSKRIAALNSTSRSSIYVIDLRKETIRLLILAKPDISEKKDNYPYILKFSSDGEHLLFSNTTEINMFTFKTNSIKTLVSLDKPKESTIPNYNEKPDISVVNVSLSPDNAYLQYTYKNFKTDVTYLKMYTIKSGNTETIPVPVNQPTVGLGWENNSTFNYSVIVEGSTETLTPIKTEIKSYEVNSKEIKTETSLNGYVEYVFDNNNIYTILVRQADLSQYIYAIDKNTYDMKRIFMLLQNTEKETVRLWGLPYMTDKYIYTTFVHIPGDMELWKIGANDVDQTSPQTVIESSRLSY